MARKLEIEIVGDASSLRRAVGQADSSTSKLGGGLRKLGKAGLVSAGAAGVGALVYTLKTGIGEFVEAQKVTAQTRSVLKSTGGAAHVSAKQVSELANSIMRKSGIDDEAIQSGENLLLTFTNVRNEVGKGNDIFNQATGIMADMSTALGQDMTSSAVQLGKALNDPIKGVTALQRVGVSFTDGQKAMIKKLVESGNTLGAQKLILRELNKEFGGSAAAMGKTLPGQINILKQRFNNFSGELVAKTIPVIQRLVAWLREHWPEISAKIQEFWTTVRPLLQAFAEFVKTIAGLIQKHWGTIGPILEDIARMIKNSIGVIVDSLQLLTALLRGDWSQAWEEMKQIVMRFVTAIKNMLALAKDTLGLAAKKIGTAIKDAIVGGITGVANAAWDVINNIGAKITEKIGAIGNWGEAVGSKLKSGAVAGIAGIAGAAWDVINNIADKIAEKASAILGWGSTIGEGIKTGFKTAMSGLYAIFKAALNTVISAWNALRIPGFKIKLPGPIPDINFPGIGLPDIPLLAKGGIVSTPTLAMVGERGPEAVVPLNRGGGMPVKVDLVLDSQVLASVLVDPLRGEVRQLQARGGAF